MKNTWESQAVETWQHIRLQSFHTWLFASGFLMSSTTEYVIDWHLHYVNLGEGC